MRSTDALSLAVELGQCLDAAGLPKDLLDLERLVRSSDALDKQRVRELMVETMGEDDERVRAWDELVRQAS